MTDTLNTLIREVCADNLHIYENQKLAQLVFDATPPDRIEDFYRQALTYCVPVINAGARNQKFCDAEQPRSGRGRPPGTTQAGAALDYREQVMRMRLGIPGAGQMPFRVCTIEQFGEYGHTVVDGGRAQIANGEKYIRAEEYGRERGYKTGEDFTEADLREIFGD